MGGNGYWKSLFYVTKYSTINGIFRIVVQGLLYTANLNIAMTQGTRLVHKVFVALQSPSHRALSAPLFANCMALGQVVLFRSFSQRKDHLIHSSGFHIPNNLLLGGLPTASTEPLPSFVVTQPGVVWRTLLAIARCCQEVWRAGGPHFHLLLAWG